MKITNKMFFTAFLALVIAAGCSPEEAEHYEPTEDDVPEEQAVTEVEEREPNQVLIRDQSFDPQVLLVEKGTTVEWINLADQHHRIVSSEDTTYFRSGNMVNGETYTFTFDSIGEFEYHDMYYPNQMTGRIKVEEPGDVVRRDEP